MKRVLFFFSIIICTSTSYTSQHKAKKPLYKNLPLKKNQQPHNKELNQKKSPNNILQKHRNSFSQKNNPSVTPYWELLPKELRASIITYASQNISASSIKDANLKFKKLLLINKESSALVNTQLFTDNYINNLSAQYSWAHESIAKSLNTTWAKKRISLQKKLRILSDDDADNNDADNNNNEVNKLLLQKLITRKVNLEFIYSDQKTALISSMEFNNGMFQLLHENGANINGTNSTGDAPLHVAASSPISKSYITRLLNTPNVALDQQNVDGETPLLRLIAQSPRQRINWPLINAVNAMLKAGANPKSANQRGLTPLNAAKKLKNRMLIGILQRATRAKSAPKQ